MLEFDNTDFITDMRNYNRCDVGSEFDEFFSQCDNFIENWTATDNGRHAGSDSIGYFHIEISLRNLIYLAVASVPEDVQLTLDILL